MNQWKLAKSKYPWVWWQVYSSVFSLTSLFKCFQILTWVWLSCYSSMKWKIAKFRDSTRADILVYSSITWSCQRKANIRKLTQVQGKWYSNIGKSLLEYVCFSLSFTLCLKCTWALFLWYLSIRKTILEYSWLMFHLMYSFSEEPEDTRA